MKISVALCTYNGASFLSEQLQSIFSQSYPVTEIIICDDKSVDNTIRIINDFQHLYPGIIRLYINEKNIGFVKNFEKAISLCDGEVIFISDQDDIWRNNKVEKCINFFDSYPQYYAVFSDAALIDDASENQQGTIWELIQFKAIAEKDNNIDLLKHLILHGNVITGACLAIKREALDIVMPFARIMQIFHDEWIGLKLALENRIYFLNETLIDYRLHRDQASQTLELTVNEEKKRKKRAIIYEEEGVTGVDTYIYWRRRMLALNRLKKYGIVFNQEIISLIENERKKGLLIYYKALPFYKRKKALLHLWLTRKENITVRNLMTD